MELYMGAGYVVFDGRVLEQWQPGGRTGPERLHIAIIDGSDVRITEGRGKLFLHVGTTYKAGNQLIPFVEQQRPWVERLIQEILRAKATFRPG